MPITHKHVESSAILLCFTVFGGASAGLGAAFPQIEDDLPNSEMIKFSVLGRGFGFLCGLLCCLFVVSQWNSSWSVWFMVFTTVFSSAFTFALAFIADLPFHETWLVVFPFCQGLGFSSCDAVGNHFLLEQWRDLDGSNAIGQSWVHIVHAGFTGGGLIGPFLVGALGYKLGFIVLGLLSLVPVLMLSVSSILSGSLISRSTYVVDSGAASPPMDYSDRTLNPYIVYGLEVWFFFLMGQEIAFSSWISTYVIDSGVSTSDAKAAYASSAFYAAMLFGRIAMGMSSTIKNTKNEVLLKFFVVFQMVSSTLLLVFSATRVMYSEVAYWVLLVLVVLFGFAVNSLIGMGINMIEDHECLRWESNLIVKEIIGLSVGEVVLPVLVGLAINETKPYMFMLLLFVMAVMVIGLYFIVDFLIHTKPSVECEQRRDMISSMDELRNPLMDKGNERRRVDAHYMLD